MRTDSKLEEIPFPLLRTVEASTRTITISVDFERIRRQMSNWNYNVEKQPVDTSNE